MDNVCWLREKIDMFIAHDRSTSLELLLRFKNLNVMVILFLWKCTATELIIIIYWVIITAHTSLGQAIYEYIFFGVILLLFRFITQHAYLLGGEGGSASP